MKNKNLLWLGAIGLGLYYILSKKKSTSSPKTITTDSRFSFTPQDLRTTDRPIFLTEDVGMFRRMSATISYQMPSNNPNPSLFEQKTSGKWIVVGDLPELETRLACPNEAFENSLNASGGRIDCVNVATTKDVVDYIFNKTKLKWKVSFGKRITVLRGGMPTPTNETIEVR
tara:strand:- start:2004 stop:2516 length:513 start_codon:yes stop_codon:yes gene_type:complete